MTFKGTRAAAALTIALFCCLLSSRGSASADNAKKKPAARVDKSGLRTMHERYKDVKSIAAEFTQKQTNAALGTTKSTSGHIFIRRPNMFRWQTEAPEADASVLVSNGKKVWYYKPPAKEGQNGQVYTRDAADVQSQLAIDLLDGASDIKKDFKTKDLSPGHYELTPLKPAGDVERIELFLERPTNLVYKLILFTMTGNQTELILKNLNLAAELGEKMFQFTTPPKTEEIY